MSKFIRLFIAIAIACSFHCTISAQSFSINTDGSTAHSSAMLDIKSTTKGLLIPRVTTIQRNLIAGPATGLQVYDTDLNQFYYYSSGWKVSGAYNFSTGLTNTAGTITNNLSTGVVGGQSVIGGTASGNNLTLSSTTDLTKGKLLFGTSAYDEANNRLGIGITSPVYGLDVRNTANLQTAFFYNPSGGNGKTQVVIRAGQTNDVVGLNEGVLTVQNRDGIQTALIRADGFVGASQVGTLDGVTAAIVDPSFATVAYPKGVNLNATAIVSWTFDNKWWNSKDVGLSRGGIGKLYVGNGEQGNSTGTLIAGSIGIGTTTPASSSILEINSTTKGFLPPRMTGLQAEAIVTPAVGLMIYANTGNGTIITSTGWWGYNGSTWEKLN